MADRGEYRAIRRVLLDGPDFQALGAGPRWVFVALKLNMGPSGIEVHYPDALAAQLAAQTGFRPADVAACLDRLEEAGWIERECNVVWVVRHLEFDPHMRAADAKHRKGVQNHIAGLPSLAICGRFVERYAEYFEGADPDLTERFRRGPEDPLKTPSAEGVQKTPTKGLRSTDEGGAIATTEEGEPRRESENVQSAVAASFPRTREGEAADAAADGMLAEFRGEAVRLGIERLEPTVASVWKIASGLDHTAWQDGHGKGAAAEERPRLWSLAVAKWAEDGPLTSRGFRGALKYVVAQQLDPIRQPTAPPPDSEAARIRSEQPQSGGERGGGLVRADDTPLELDNARVDKWLKEHPDEADAIRAEAMAALEEKLAGTAKAVLRKLDPDKLAQAEMRRIATERMRAA